MSEGALSKVRAILEKMLREEVLPPRAGAVIQRLSEATTPEELGMDSLARFALLGELKRVFGARRIDPLAISGARCLGDVLRAIEARGGPGEPA